MSIVFIARNKKIGDRYRRFLPNDPREVLVIESLLNQAIPDVKRLEQQGAEVFVARGGTAMHFRQKGIDIPLVEIYLTSRDIVQALAEAKLIVRSKNPRIAVVAYTNMIKNLLDFSPYLKLHLTFYQFGSEEEAHESLHMAIANGAEVVMGGAITIQIAKEHGFPAVFLNSEESSIQTAYKEAKQIVSARRREARRSSELNTMLEYAYEGIIAVNSEGRITVFNPVAETVTGVRAENALGSLSLEIIPLVRLEEVVQSGNEDIGQVVDFGNSKVMMNRVPVNVHGKIVGPSPRFKTLRGSNPWRRGSAVRYTARGMLQNSLSGAYCALVSRCKNQLIQQSVMPRLTRRS